MNEPFMLAVSGRPEESIWHYEAPVRFKNPERAICLVPMDTPVMSGDREMYTAVELEKNSAVWKTAIDNTATVPLRMSIENDMVSIRSSKSAGTPCAAVLLLPGSKRRAKLLAPVSEYLKKNGMPPIQGHYFVFITQDEILLADKAKIKPSILKKTLRSIKNQLEAMNPDLLLATEVLEYDQDEDEYREV